MTELLVIVPTRGRPANAERLAKAFDATTGPGSTVLFAVDEDDPTLDEYRSRLHGWHLAFFPRLSMVAKLNRAAAERASLQPYLGFMGDDHLPLTEGWDRKVIDSLASRGPGIAYCNDLFQGPTLPTAVFMHSYIVQTLGWMALPTVEHLYCDNAWLDLGQALESVEYFPHVVIEHVHPHARKSPDDEQYQRVNSPERHAEDRAAWELWRTTRLHEDVAHIRGEHAA